MCNWKEVEVPAWYELFYKDQATLGIRLHQAAWGYIKTKLVISIPGVQDLLSNYPGKQFIEPTFGVWGMDGCIKPLAETRSAWLDWKVDLPIIKARRGGKETKQSEYFAMRSTLSLLFNLLWLYGYQDNGAAGSEPQLLIIEGINVGHDFYGGALSAIITPTVANWLSQFPDNHELATVSTAMQAADQYMWYTPTRRRDKFPEFHARVRQPKYIHLTVPGNACGLDPDYSGLYRDKPNGGYVLHPHNTDTSLQQLTLLMGLAKLHDLMRQPNKP